MTEADRLMVRSQLSDRRDRLEAIENRQPGAPHLKQLLRDVDAALARMEDGTWGICETCHDSIERERLLVDPLVTRCLDHLTERQRHALQDDLDLALRIQTGLLPPATVATAGWDTAYHYEPLGMVSGDFCDLIPHTGGGFFFSLGDVSGKGVASSLLMSHLHAIFRSLLSVGLSLAEVVRRANRLFCEGTPKTHYATLVCGLAAADGKVELCNAGHCAPVWIHGKGTEQVEATGLPVGLFCDADFSTTRLVLGPGDLLVLHTDGLTEATGESDIEYGTQRLHQVLSGLHRQSPREVLDALTADLRNHLAGTAPSDDLTMMVLGRGPSVS
jgi:phosphoserine phosphatase RsbU/P